MVALAAVGSVLSGIGAIGGLFGKKKAPSPHDNIMSQARGAIDASKEYGFNPLTMLQYGQPGGSLASSPVPPLASLDFLKEALTDLDAELNGDNNRQREMDQINVDLARIRRDQARAGVAIEPVSAARSVGAGPLPIGQRPVTVLPGGSVTEVANASAQGAVSGNDVYSSGVYNSGLPAGDDSDPVKEAERRGIPAFRLWGKDFIGSGKTSNAQTFQNSGGELAEYVGGLAAIGDALGATLHRDAIERSDKPRSPRPKPKPYFGSNYNARHLGPLIRLGQPPMQWPHP